MGSMIRPVCAKCEAEFEVLFLGGTNNNGQKECAVPVICDNCGTIKTDNILKPEHNCKKCGNPILYAGNVTNKETRASVFTWMLTVDFDNPSYYVLKSNFYRCPRCHTKNLSFETAGCWD